jgi:hypothetical protein
LKTSKTLVKFWGLSRGGQEEVEKRQKKVFKNFFLLNPTAITRSKRLWTCCQSYKPLQSSNGTAHFLFSLDIEGVSEKISQFIVQVKSIFNKNVYFNEQKCTF